MFRTKSETLFLESLRERRTDAAEYEFIGPYIATTVPIMVRHLICGMAFEALPAEMNRKKSPKRCPSCNEPKNRPTPIEVIQQEIAWIGNQEFELISGGGTESSLLTIKHKVCQSIIKVYRGNMLTWGLKCKNCEDLTKRQNRAELIKASSQGRYELLSSYQGYNERVMVIDNNQNKVYSVRYSSLRNRILQEYPESVVLLKQKKESKEEWVSSHSQGRYKLISEYMNSKGKLKVLDAQSNTVMQMAYSTLMRRIRELSLSDASMVERD